MCFVNLRSRSVLAKVGNAMYHTAQIFLYYLSSDKPSSDTCLGNMGLLETIVVHFMTAPDDSCMCNRTTVVIIM